MQNVQNVVRLSALVQPELPQDVMKRTAESMSLDDLLSFEKAFQKAADQLLPVSPQLAPEKRERQESSKKSSV